MENLEIERKYLLKPVCIERFLKKGGFKFKESSIAQFYLPAKEGEVVRYRSKDGKFIKTVKRGEGVVREEIEEEVNREEFAEALLKKEGFFIKKKRYSLEYGGKTYEFDKFLGNLKGLIYLEIEFENEQEAEQFEIPEVFKDLVLQEVSQDSRFSNKALSLSGAIPSIEQDLKTVLSEIKPQSKAALNLKPHPFISLDSLLKMAIYALTESIKINQKAILSGSSDSENLHQLRVAARKLKSYFKNFQSFFAGDEAQTQIECLNLVLKSTNSARDSDVFLENLQKFEKNLPQKLQENMKKLQDSIKSKQRNTTLEVKKFLNSSFFKCYLQRLQEIVENSDKFSQNAKTPAVIIYQNRFAAQKKEFLKKAKKIKKSRSSKQLHKLRIEGKKIRYLNELFAAAAKEKSNEKLEKNLKKLQNILGEYNDLYIEKTELKSIKKENRKIAKHLLKDIKKRQKSLRKKFKKLVS